MPVRWADVSYYQPVVNDSYPHPVLCIRSNDGTFRDPKFHQNYTWATRALDSGKLQILIIYFVYRPPGETSVNTLKSMMPTPHPRVVVMIDVESWGGQIQGNQSHHLNRVHGTLSQWLGSARRVVAYGNRGDLTSLWPVRPPGLRLIVASYPKRPQMAGMIAHQFSSTEPCPPFGPCDANIAYDYDVQSLAEEFGLIGTASREPWIEHDKWKVEGNDMGDLDNIIIGPGGLPLKHRIVLGCPTGALALSKRRAWLSFIALELHDNAWVQVYTQGSTGGTGQWEWTQAALRARDDHYLPRAWREIPPETSHMIVSWDLTMCPEGGTLCLETRPTA